MVSGQWSVVSGQWSVNEITLTINNTQLTKNLSRLGTFLLLRIDLLAISNHRDDCAQMPGEHHALCRFHHIFRELFDRSASPQQMNIRNQNDE